MGDQKPKFLEQYNDKDNEVFVREALIFLEREFRKMCLIVLGEMTTHNIIVKSMYGEIGGIQAPSWGNWNGFLLGAFKARRGILSTGKPEERESINGAAEFAWLAGRMEQVEEISTKDLLEKLSNVTGYTAGKNSKGIRARDMLSIPIQLRNRIAHDNVIDASWWEAAGFILNYVTKWYIDSDIYSHVHLEVAVEPWLLKAEGETWCYNGIESKGENSFAVYVSMSGKAKLIQAQAPSVMSAFIKLLGNEQQQEINFKRLMSKLAPEEVKGFLSGDYMIGEKAGEGGYAEVYRGLQLSTGRRVAIKILKPGLSELDRARFLQEAEYLSRFDHPNIIKVYEHDEQPWRMSRLYDLSNEAWFKEFKKNHGSILTFIAIEWIEGKTLDEIFKEIQEGKRKNDERETAGWFASAAEALEVIHNTNLIHRDISPKNIMLTDNGVIKLMDFGISRSQSSDRTIMTSHGRILGTEAYMSPEQLDYEKARAELGPLSDIYSLGATFYELFTMTRLYDHNNDERSVSIATEMKKRGEQPRTPITIKKDLSLEISIILMGCLENNQGDRYKSAQKLKEDIVSFLNDRAIEYKKPSRRRRMRLFYRRNRRMVSVVTLFILLIFFTTTIYMIWINIEKNRAVTAETKSRQSLAKMYYKQADEEIANNDSRSAMGYLAASLKSYKSEDAAGKLASMFQNDVWPIPKGELPGGIIPGSGGYIINKQNNQNIKLMELSGKLKVELSNSMGSGNILASNDGNYIAEITLGVDQGIRVWGSDGKRISTPSISVNGGYNGFSSDGKWLYVNLKSSSFCLLPMDGGKPRYFNPVVQKSKFYEELLPGMVEASIIVYDNGNAIAYQYGGRLGLYQYNGTEYKNLVQYDLADFFEYRKDSFGDLNSIVKDTSKTDPFLMNLLLYISKDMKRLVVTNSGSFAVLDAASGKRLFTELDMKYLISDIAFSGTRDELVVDRYAPYTSGTSYGGGNISVFDLKNYKKLPMALTKLDLPFTSIKYSGDSSLLLAVDKSQGIYIFDMKTGEQLCQPVYTPGTVMSARFTDNQHVIADVLISDGSGKNLNSSIKKLIFDIGNKYQTRLAELDMPIGILNSSADGKRLYAGSNRGLYCVDPVKGKELFFAPIQSEELPALMSMDIDNSSRKILLTYADMTMTGDKKGNVMVYQGDEPKLLSDINIKGYTPDDATFSPSGKKFLLMCSNLERGGYLQIWDCSKDKLVACSSKISSGNSSGRSFIKSAWISEEKGIIAVDDHSIYVLQTDGSIKSSVSPEELKTSYIKAIKVSSDGKYLAVVSGALMTTDGVTKENVLVYKVEDIIKGTASAAYKNILTSTPSKLVISPDGTKIAVGCLDGTVVLSDFPEVSNGVALLKNQGEIHDLKFDNSSKFIITAIDSSGPRNQVEYRFDKSIGRSVPSIMVYSSRYAIWYGEDQKLIYQSPLFDQKAPVIGVTGDNQVVVAAGEVLYKQWVPEKVNPDWIASFAEMLSGYELTESTALTRINKGYEDMISIISENKDQSYWQKIIKSILGDGK